VDSPSRLETRAVSAYLNGRYDDSANLWVRAYERWVEEEVFDRAVRCAFWLAMGLQDRGQGAKANGWLTRAARLAEDRLVAKAAPGEARDAQVAGVARGYLLAPTAIRQMFGGDAKDALASFNEMARIAERCSDVDLVALSALGRGNCLIRLGQSAEGRALLDELLLDLASDDVLPMVAGLVYCAVIEMSRATFDTERAREWTAALGDWCSTRPGVMGYRGRCHVYRAEVMQIQGAWSDALEESQLASARFPEAHPAAGGAQYRQAEIHRLRGNQNRGVVESVPGLYFIGLHFLYAMSSAMIHGVGRDAEYIAMHITRSAGHDSPALAIVAERP
jgi:tetratricopeptide (TPR) repeat protein